MAHPVEKSSIVRSKWNINKTKLFPPLKTKFNSHSLIHNSSVHWKSIYKIRFMPWNVLRLRGIDCVSNPRGIWCDFVVHSWPFDSVWLACYSPARNTNQCPLISVWQQTHDWAASIFLFGAILFVECCLRAHWIHCCNGNVLACGHMA